MKRNLAIIVLAVLVSGILWAQHTRIKRLTAERDKYRDNTEILLGDVKTYQTKDSLNAAEVGMLRLSLDEYKQYRAEDLKLIKTLRAKAGELSAVTTAQAEMIAKLKARPKDTLIIRDSIPIPARLVRCGDAWYDFEGLMTEDSFEGKLASRDSIVVTETVKYKRFLGFLWKTNKVKSRKVNIVNRNPHSKIVGAECIVIED